MILLLCTRRSDSEFVQCRIDDHNPVYSYTLELDLKPLRDPFAPTSSPIDHHTDSISLACRTDIKLAGRIGRASQVTSLQSKCTYCIRDCGYVLAQATFVSTSKTGMKLENSAYKNQYLRFYFRLVQ